jgi:formylglycine-generating enzyme required for sulfatase activity
LTKSVSRAKMTLMKRFIAAPIIWLNLLLLISCSHSLKGTYPEQDGMITIPKGVFRIGPEAVEMNARIAHDVFLEAFMIDKYEVSARDFAKFLNNKGNPGDRYFSHDEYSTVMGVLFGRGTVIETKGLPDVYVPRSGFEHFPANNVSWFGAYEYCAWKGKRLPTEAEWEKAARGNDGRIYPWGNTLPNDSKARYDQKWKEKGLNVMVPVVTLHDGASYYGVFNMAGNVWEWVDDWFKRDYCEYCIHENHCVPCQDGGACNHCPEEPPAVGDFKVLRGGSWYDSQGEAVIRSTNRYWLGPEERFPHTGVRCAK